MTIAEVSRRYDISADTLRYYERIGLIPPVHRTAGGIRDYTEDDCRWGEFCNCMRAARLTINSLPCITIPLPYSWTTMSTQAPGVQTWSGSI